ncbi:hypothetical protein H7347_07415 [Corynebacterium sp. zg-331]|uniref:hypothetical protein n=1 Tax=unclassified Corynebacterium TaxID=2624378 RepID=UPI001642AFBB|nr:hypothetical protein [Corynebacterium sp. zg-331]
MIRTPWAGIDGAYEAIEQLARVADYAPEQQEVLEAFDGGAYLFQELLARCCWIPRHCAPRYGRWSARGR